MFYYLELLIYFLYYFKFLCVTELQTYL